MGEGGWQRGTSHSVLAIQCFLTVSLKNSVSCYISILQQLKSVLFHYQITTQFTYKETLISKYDGEFCKLLYLPFVPFHFDLFNISTQRKIIELYYLIFLFMFLN